MVPVMIVLGLLDHQYINTEVAEHNFYYDFHLFRQHQ